MVRNAFTERGKGQVTWHLVNCGVICICSEYDEKALSGLWHYGSLRNANQEPGGKKGVSEEPDFREPCTKFLHHYSESSNTD